jgi:hypothetical protein
MANKPSVFSKIIKKCSTDRLIKMRIMITKLISSRTATN